MESPLNSMHLCQPETNNWMSKKWKKKIFFQAICERHHKYSDGMCSVKCIALFGIVLLKRNSLFFHKK